MTTKLASAREPCPPLAEDILRGAGQIAKFVFGGDDHRDRRKVYHLAERKAIPTFRLGAQICARPSVLLRWVAAQESDDRTAGRTPNDPMTAQFTSASRARLDATIAALERAGVAHMVPILHAVRDCGVAYITLTQGDQRVSLPDLSTRPWIAVIGDDTDRALGPNGFSPAALATLAAGANAAIVVAGAPDGRPLCLCCGAGGNGSQCHRRRDPPRPRDRLDALAAGFGTRGRRAGERATVRQRLTDPHPYVATRAIQAAVKGREAEVLDSARHRPAGRLHAYPLPVPRSHRRLAVLAVQQRQAPRVLHLH